MPKTESAKTKHTVGFSSPLSNLCAVGNCAFGAEETLLAFTEPEPPGRGGSHDPGTSLGDGHR